MCVNVCNFSGSLGVINHICIAMFISITSTEQWSICFYPFRTYVCMFLCCCFFVCVWVCQLVRLIHCRPVSNFTEKLHPSPKVKADFFQTQKLTWCPYPICTIFGVCIKCMQVFIFCAKYIDINPFCAGVLNAMSVIFFKSSLNIIVNFIEWNLTDSN